MPESLLWSTPITAEEEEHPEVVRVREERCKRRRILQDALDKRYRDAVAHTARRAAEREAREERAKAVAAAAAAAAAIAANAGEGAEPVDDILDLLLG